MLKGIKLVCSFLFLISVAMIVGCSECQPCQSGPQGGVTKTTYTFNGETWEKDAGTDIATNKTIAIIIQERKQFSTFAKAWEKADMMSVLTGSGPYTVFAPTNEAFDKLPAGMLDKLLSADYKTDLRQLLNYHVISGKVSSSDLEKLTASDSLLGESFKITRKSGSVWIDNAKVIQSDISACNGYINEIDRVLVPCDLQKRIRQMTMATDKGTAGLTEGEIKNIAETAADLAELSIFYDAIKAADMTEMLSGEGTFTVFAPTNDAWNKLSEAQFTELFEPQNKAKLQNILKMHVVKGDALMEGDISKKTSVGTLGDRMINVRTRDGALTLDNDKAAITKPDIQASNGVIHEIDTIIFP